MLTMEWIEGVKLTDEIGLRSYGRKAVDFVDLGVDCTMRQLLEHGGLRDAILFRFVLL